MAPPKAGTNKKAAAPAPAKNDGSIKILGTTVPGGAYALAMAGIGAAAIGATVYFAARFADAVSTPIIYHALVFGAAFGLYMTMPGGFERHFNVPAVRKMNVADTIYYTAVTHTTLGLGDVFPTSLYSRCVVAAHIGLVFLATASLIPLGNR